MQVVNDDGSLLSTAIHACCLALLHAGVPLRGLLAGCAIALLADGQLILDPTQDEEADAKAVLTAAFLYRRLYVTADHAQALCP